MTHERQRTSSAELETSATISLGTQLDSSLLVLVADVSSFALRPSPIFNSCQDFGASINQLLKTPLALRRARSCVVGSQRFREWGDSPSLPLSLQ